MQRIVHGSSHLVSGRVAPPPTQVQLMVMPLPTQFVRLSTIPLFKSLVSALTSPMEAKAIRKYLIIVKITFDALSLQLVINCLARMMRSPRRLGLVSKA